MPRKQPRRIENASFLKSDPETSRSVIRWVEKSVIRNPRPLFGPQENGAEKGEGLRHVELRPRRDHKHRLKAVHKSPLDMTIGKATTHCAPPSFRLESELRSSRQFHQSGE